MDDQLKKIRHSTSHVLAQAVLKLYPNAKLAIGPAIEEGFYYDFDLGDSSFSTEDLGKLEKLMSQIISENQQLVQERMSVDEAIEFFKKKNQPYKVELAQEFKSRGEKEVGINRMVANDGTERFIDLCAGNHAASTKEIGAYKLLRLAGAYWHGDENNKMLQRIYGTAFATKQELNAYLEQL